MTYMKPFFSLSSKGLLRLPFFQIDVFFGVVFSVPKTSSFEELGNGCGLRVKGAAVFISGCVRYAGAGDVGDPENLDFEL